MVYCYCSKEIRRFAHLAGKRWISSAYISEKEDVKTFQEYDEKYTIHDPCEEWMQVLQSLLKNGDKELFDSVTACCKKMQEL